MRIFRCSILLPVMLALVGLLSAQEPETPRILPPPAEHRFLDRQTLHYGVEWRLLQAGTARFRLEPAGREMRVTASADASGAVALLLHVRDRFEAFFDPASHCSRSLTKHTEEGFRRLETEIVFDGAAGKALLREKNLKLGRAKQAEHPIPGCVTDVISALYYLASLPLAADGSYLFPLNDGGPTVHIRATVESQEEVKTPAGDFTATRVAVRAETGPLANRGAIWIWFADDGLRTPVQMKARLFWGTLTFRLVRVDHDPAR